MQHALGRHSLGSWEFMHSFSSPGVHRTAKQSFCWNVSIYTHTHPQCVWLSPLWRPPLWHEPQDDAAARGSERGKESSVTTWRFPVSPNHRHIRFPRSTNPCHSKYARKILHLLASARYVAGFVIGRKKCVPSITQGGTRCSREACSPIRALHIRHEDV